MENVKQAPSLKNTFIYIKNKNDLMIFDLYVDLAKDQGFDFFLSKERTINSINNGSNVVAVDPDGAIVAFTVPDCLLSLNLKELRFDGLPILKELTSDYFEQFWQANQLTQPSNEQARQFGIEIKNKIVSFNDIVSDISLFCVPTVKVSAESDSMQFGIELNNKVTECKAFVPLKDLKEMVNDLERMAKSALND